MKMKEISNKTVADLTKMLTEKREALRVSRFGSAGSKNKNVKESVSIRRDIARIMTSLNALKIETKK